MYMPHLQLSSMISEKKEELQEALLEKELSCKKELVICSQMLTINLTKCKSKSEKTIEFEGKENDENVCLVTTQPFNKGSLDTRDKCHWKHSLFASAVPGYHVY